MSGKILVVDSVATNRIVLKVKLSAAFYSVAQASSLAEAVDHVSQDMPHVILCAAELPDGSIHALVDTLHKLPGGERVSVMALLNTDRVEPRLALLNAGVQDVLVKPFAEAELLARLRRFNRRRQESADLAMRGDTALALGFGEAPAGFSHPGRIAVIDSGSIELQKLSHALRHQNRHHISFGKLGSEGDAPQADSVFSKATISLETADVVLIHIGTGSQNEALSRLAQLRTAETSRHARIVVFLREPDQAAALAASVLDLGADDIVDASMDIREINLRLHQQVRSKQADDLRRLRLQTGLQAAVTDPLTGLYNRRFALAELQRLIDLSRHHGDSFTVMVADLDHFKSVNDTYGHAAGDIVLASVASQLRGGLNENDIVARIGGEEFLILLPDTDRRQASVTADQLCDIIRNAHINLPNQRQPVQVTISIGVTVVRHHENETLPTIEGILGQADKALYGSKSDGRDTVTFDQLSAA